MDSVMDLFDWSTNVPRSNKFLTEDDFKESCTYKIIMGTFRDPLLSESESDSDSEISQKPLLRKIISYSYGSHTRRFHDKAKGKEFKYIPGLCPPPYFTSLSSLDKETHLACLKVLASEDTAITRHTLPLDPPTKSDLAIFKKSKNTIAKEQREFVECAKKLWLSNHCVRVLKHPSSVEAVEKKYLEAQSAKIRQLPQNYEFYEVVNISTIANVDFIHRQNIYKVRDVPHINIPNYRKITLTQNQTPRQGKTHSTNEATTPDVGHRAELLEYLSGVGYSQDVDVVVAASALCCLQDNDTSWLVPVTVLPARIEDGKPKKLVVLEGEIQIPAPMGTTKMERAYTQLLRELLTRPNRDLSLQPDLEPDLEDLESLCAHETFGVASKRLNTNVRSQEQMVETDLFGKKIREPSITTEMGNDPEEIQSHDNKLDEAHPNVNILEEAQSDIEIRKEIQPDVNIQKRTQPHVNILKETQPDVDILEETQPNVDKLKETQSHVEIRKETQPDVNIPKETQSDVNILEATQSHVDVLKETQSDVRILKETQLDVDILKETQSVINILEDTLPDFDILEETLPDVDFLEETLPDVNKWEETQPYVNNVNETPINVPNECSDNDSESDIDVLVIVEEEEIEEECRSESSSNAVSATSPKSVDKEAHSRRPSLYEEEIQVNQPTSNTYAGPMTRCRTAGKDPTSPRTRRGQNLFTQSYTNSASTKEKGDIPESPNESTMMKPSPMKPGCKRKHSTASSDLNSGCGGDTDTDNVTLDATSVLRSGKILMDPEFKSAPLKYPPTYTKPTCPDSKEIKINAGETFGEETDRPTGPWRFSGEKPVYPFNTMGKLADDLPESKNVGHQDSKAVTKNQDKSSKDKAELMKNIVEPKEVSSEGLTKTLQPIEHLSERQFDKWELCTPGGKDNLSMIVHCSQQLRMENGDPVLAVPILEYQADVGATRLRHLQARALALHLRSARAQLLTARVNPVTSELLSLEWSTLEALLNKESATGAKASLQSAFSILHRTLGALQRLQPGNYMLRHDAKQSFSHIYIYKECASFDTRAAQDFAGKKINLHQLSLWPEAGSEADAPAPPPSLCAAILPWHRYRQILPLVFLPHDMKQSKQHRELRIREQKKSLNVPIPINKKKNKKKYKK